MQTRKQHEVSKNKKKMGSTIMLLICLSQMKTDQSLPQKEECEECLSEASDVDYHGCVFTEENTPSSPAKKPINLEECEPARSSMNFLFQYN